MINSGSTDYKISSSGLAREKNPSLLGIYRLTKENMNGRSVYKHQKSTSFLYVNAYNDWVVNGELNPLNANFFSKTDTALPPNTGWKINIPAVLDKTLTVRKNV